MKIAVASNDGKKLTGHVGKCEMFIVFETIKDGIHHSEIRMNNFTLHKAEGNNHVHNIGGQNHQLKSHSRLVNGLQDCSYLICSSCGPGLVNDLLSSGIQIILTEEMEAEKAVKLLIEGKLESDPERKCKEHNH